MSKRAPVKMVIVHKKTWAKREIEVPFGGTFELDKHEDVDWQATQGLYWRRVDDLEAENARLQVCVEALETALDGIGDITPKLQRCVKELQAERDGYKVLAERRREALVKLADKCDEVAEATIGIFTMAMIHGNNYDGPTFEQELKDARAAIDLTPEEVREKEGER